MKSTLSKVLIFAAGAAIGSGVTWYLTKTKYEQILREEEAATRAYYENRYGTQDTETSDETEDREDYRGPTSEDVDSFVDIVRDCGYTTCSDAERDAVKNGVEKRMLVDPPYTITADEYGEMDGYETIDLIFWADGALTDDDYELVDDVEDTVGRANLATFGDHEDDTVFVRNDRLKCDYEICFDQRDFWEPEEIVAGQENLGEGDTVYDDDYDDEDDYDDDIDPQDAEEE